MAYHAMAAEWYSRPELNGDPRFRKPLLYPFELRERPAQRQNVKAPGICFKPKHERAGIAGEIALD